jgi:hypothetical protein
MGILLILVMRGLDPRIHPKNSFQVMDCRVEPGNDITLFGVERGEQPVDQGL